MRKSKKRIWKKLRIYYSKSKSKSKTRSRASTTWKITWVEINYTWTWVQVNKKTNDSLYRKLQLLTYSRTKDSYKTLKDIDYNIHKTDTTPKTNCSKRLSRKWKTLDDEGNVSYNLYVKYKAWYDVGWPHDSENYKLFISDTEDSYWTEN